MPWYEEESDDDTNHLTGNPLAIPSTGACSQPVTLDPFTCSVEIRMQDDTEVAWVRQLYSPFLQWIDPAFQLIRIKDESTDHYTLVAKSLAQSMRSPKVEFQPTAQARVLDTQSLSIVLFLREDTASQLTAQAARKYLDRSPWEFHHKIELANHRDLRPVACQEYYQLFPTLPLWAVCSVHYGNEQLRFNLFTRNFEEMKTFYSAVTEKELVASRAGFCSFHLYSQPGLDIQLALKFSPYLNPRVTEAAMLRFKVTNVNQLRERLVFPLMPSGDSNTWLTRDPDDNIITLVCECPCAQTLPQLLTDTSDSGEWSRSETSSNELDTSWNSTWETASI